MATESINFTVLYGSETGTAQDTAEEIWKSAKRYNLKCSVMAMDDYSPENLNSERLLIFIASTTGQGDPPQNMRRFWRFLLRKSLPRDLLQHLNYAVLGLGDSSYEKFNFAAKKLHKRLAQLGAKSLLPLALADDQHDLGIDATLAPWSTELWSSIAQTFNQPLTNCINTSKIIERFKVTILPPNPTFSPSGDIYRQELAVNSDLKLAKVIGNTRTTSLDHFQDVRLIKLGFESIEYEPGDILYVRPKNSPSQVRNFLDLLSECDPPLTPHTLLRVSEDEIKLPRALERPLMLEEVATEFWDLNYKPRRSAMQILATISTDELEREKLMEFGSAAGQQELFDYVNRPRRNVVEVLRDFPHTTKRLNVRVLFEIMVPIKPRAFSIASSNKFSPNQVELLVAVVKYRTRLVEPRLGLCSNWLASLEVGREILCWLQKGTFHFQVDKPGIFVGPGTGIAAFRALLLDRAAANHDLKDVLLFFGCRNSDKDYHCREDFEFLTSKHGLKVCCAFSRDQPEKIYVQHVIRKHAEVCWRMLENSGCIYLSGSAKNMPKCVRDEFVDLAKECGQMDDLQAEEFVRNLEITGRYQTETWS